MSHHQLPRATPESQGVPSSALVRLTEALDAVEHVHTVTVVRHGFVVGETTWAPYDREAPHSLFSVSKSFTSIATGLAIEEGLFGLDDPVLGLLPDQAPAAPSARHRALTVRHLLNMTTGHDSEPDEWTTGDWAATILAAPLDHDPGAHWTYNTAATYLLSAIIQRASGERLLDYLAPRLFLPLGFRDPTWEQSPQGIDTGGYGLSVRAEELAAFGQLLLQGGRWHGVQLVPEAWIATATTAQADNRHPGGAPDWVQGYGFQFWRCRHGAYRGDGAFGQYVVVLPEHDAVVAITGGLPDMQQPLDAIWRHLLPAFDADPLPTAEEVPSTLSIPPVGGDRRAADLTFRYDGPVSRLRVTADAVEWGESAFAVDPDAWTTGIHEDHPVAVSGGWHGDEFVCELRLLDTPFTYRAVLALDGALDLTSDVAFGDRHLWAGVPVAAS